MRKLISLFKIQDDTIKYDKLFTDINNFVIDDHDKSFTGSEKQRTVVLLNFNSNINKPCFSNDILRLITDYLYTDPHDIYSLYLTSKMFHIPIKKMEFIKTDKLTCHKHLNYSSIFPNLKRIVFRNYKFKDPDMVKKLPSHKLTQADIINTLIKCNSSHLEEIELLSCEFGRLIIKDFYRNLKSNDHLKWVYLYRIDGLFVKHINKLLYISKLKSTRFVIRNTIFIDSGYNLRLMENMSFYENYSTKIPYIMLKNCDIGDLFFLHDSRKLCRNNIEYIDVSHNYISNKLWVFRPLAIFNDLKTLNLKGTLIKVEHINSMINKWPKTQLICN